MEPLVDLSDPGVNMTPRYAPSSVIVLTPKGFVRADVTASILHPPGVRPKESPIRSKFYTLELQTPHGSRWYGVRLGWINSELRLVISGFPTAFEEMSSWPYCTTP